MKPLLVLLISFVITLVGFKVFKKEYFIYASARIAMASMLVFTSIGHFIFTKGMSMMIPPIVPYPIIFVYLTGVLEIGMAIGLLIPKLFRITGWLLIVFLVCMLPANIYAVIHKIDYQTGTFGGNGLSYLWFRIPLQCFFIIWTHHSTVRYLKYKNATNESNFRK